MSGFQKIILLMLLCFGSSIAFAQKANDTVRYVTISRDMDSLMVNNQSPIHSDDDFAPGLLFFALFALGCICVMVGIGLLLALMATLILIGLLAIGIISTSVIVGLQKKSLEKGFKTFVVLICSFGGSLSVAILFPFINYVLHEAVYAKALVAGVIIGAISGFVMGQMAFVLLKRLALYLKSKIEQ